MVSEAQDQINAVNKELTGMIDKVTAMARNIHFERLALTKKQVMEYNLPSRPPKIVKGRVIDSGTATEVDAMDTDTLLNIVEKAIQRHFPERNLKALRKLEEKEREVLSKLTVPAGGGSP